MISIVRLARSFGSWTWRHWSLRRCQCDESSALCEVATRALHKQHICTTHSCSVDTGQCTADRRVIVKALCTWWWPQQTETCSTCKRVVSIPGLYRLGDNKHYITMLRFFVNVLKGKLICCSIMNAVTLLVPINKLQASEQHKSQYFVKVCHNCWGFSEHFNKDDTSLDDISF
jgi:hypothetical protein